MLEHHHDVMGAHGYSISIDASPDAVWKTFTDLDRIPEWQTGHPVVSEASGPGDIVGTTYLVRRGPGVSRTVVVEATSPHRYRSRTEAYLGLSFEMVAHLIPENEGTRLELTARTQWPWHLRLLGRLIEAVLLSGHEASRELKQLKLLVEGSRSSPT